MSLKLSIGNDFGLRYLKVENYVLDYDNFYTKERLELHIKDQRAKIELALEQLKDIEMMSKEL